MISTISKKVAFPDLFLYEALKGSELSPIPPLEPSGAAALGNRGRDRFGVMRSFLVSHLPIYKPGERNAMGTGGSRQICCGLSGTVKWGSIIYSWNPGGYRHAFVMQDYQVEYTTRAWSSRWRLSLSRCGCEARRPANHAGTRHDPTASHAVTVASSNSNTHG